MKKRLPLAFSFFLLIGCGNDRASEDISASTDNSLNGAQMSPSATVVTGSGQPVYFTLTKNSKTIDNSNFEWTVADTLVGNVSNGVFTSRIIGTTKVNAKDLKGNVISSSITVQPKITDISDIPYLKWDASYNEVKANVNWTLTSAPYPYIELYYKKGKDGIIYYTSSGLWKVEFIPNVGETSFTSGLLDSNKLVDYNNERFVRMKPNDGHYYGYARWWYVNSIDNKKVYVDIGREGGAYYLRFSKS